MSGLALQLCAGAAFVIWPDQAWIAKAVFALGSALLIGSVCLWFFANYRLRWPAVARDRNDNIAGVADNAIEPKSNWYICEAMDYIVERLGLTREPESRKQFTPAIRLLTRQARAGTIRVWGKQLSSDGIPELDGREIQAEEWLNREILFEAWTPSAKEPQTRSTIGSQNDYQFTDLHVNATEIKAINWQSENDLGC